MCMSMGGTLPCSAAVEVDGAGATRGCWLALADAGGGNGRSVVPFFRCTVAVECEHVRVAAQPRSGEVGPIKRRPSANGATVMTDRDRRGRGGRGG